MCIVLRVAGTWVSWLLQLQYSLQSSPYILLEDNALEAQTDVQTYLERGKQAIAQGQGRDAAIAYAHAAQIEPDNPMVHLGLAEANLALASYGVVYIACLNVQ